jgi:tetratricopeptide (TPR) repeat protein
MLNECGKSDQALLDISKMILAIPENPGARQARIEILEKMQKYEQALKDIDFLIVKDPDIAEWYKMKAKFQRKLNKPKDAAATEKRMKDVIEFGSK